MRTVSNVEGSVLTHSVEETSLVPVECLTRQSPKSNYYVSTYSVRKQYEGREYNTSSFGGSQEGTPGLGEDWVRG